MRVPRPPARMTAFMLVPPCGTWQQARPWFGKPQAFNTEEREEATEHHEEKQFDALRAKRNPMISPWPSVASPHVSRVQVFACGQHDRAGPDEQPNRMAGRRPPDSRQGRLPCVFTDGATPRRERQRGAASVRPERKRLRSSSPPSPCTRGGGNTVGPCHLHATRRRNAFGQ